MLNDNELYDLTASQLVREEKLILQKYDTQKKNNEFGRRNTVD